MTNEIIQTINETQSAGLLKMAHVLADCPWATAAIATGVDETGLELQAEAAGRSQSVRLPFAAPAPSEREVRMAFMALLMQADQPDGLLRQASAQVETARAGRHLKALCSHFKRHASVTQQLDSNNIGQGRVQFEFGDCLMDAQANRLTLQVEAPSELRFARIKDVVSDHLIRFAHKESLSVNWVDNGVKEKEA